MRELLQQASIHIRAWHKKYSTYRPEWLPPADDVSLLEDIDEALSRSEWVPVAERLPVVPEGAIFVKLWVFSHHGQVKKVSWHRDFEIDMAFSFTHWMYRQDDTPAPPEAV